MAKQKDDGTTSLSPPRLADRTVHCVLACSALKRQYRDILTSGKTAVPPCEYNKTNRNPECQDTLLTPSSLDQPLPLLFVYLKGSKNLILSRMKDRDSHFMPVELLDSQLACLEEPGAGEWHVTVDITADIQSIVNEVERQVHEYSQ